MSRTQRQSGREGRMSQAAHRIASAPLPGALGSARAHMILGTASGVGKSLLTAGLCRLLARSGVKVAPFKPQNMSNNAAACPAGGEIGRAQALQAFACGIEPHVDMNPMLIKPEGDRRAQLIVLGEAVGTLHASRFRQDRERHRPAVMQAFERLRNRYEWVWVEGAGSPAEPNLRQQDLANLGFARAAGVPCWLVGDIDRGGVFAALLGSLLALDPDDRAHVAGLIVNRFRGDGSLLEGTSEWLEDRTGVPVLGRVPFLRDLRLPEEDIPYQLRRRAEGSGASTHPVERARASESRGRSSIRVGCIAYPTASNVTDLDPLALDASYEVQLVDRAECASGFDLLVLPGSKAVRRDLEWLRSHGFVPMLERHLRYGGKLLGICGGMQMLGTRIRDPHAVEGGGESEGLGWLPVETELAAQKRVEALDSLAEWPRACRFTGYEIHHGRTTREGSRYPFHAVSPDEQIFGTYVHGLFDLGEYRSAVFGHWFPDVPVTSRAPDLESRWLEDLDRLADVLRDGLDLRSIEQRIGRELR